MPSRTPISMAVVSLSVIGPRVGGGSITTARFDFTRPPSSTTAEALPWSAATSITWRSAPSKSTWTRSPGRIEANTDAGHSVISEAAPMTSAAWRATVVPAVSTVPSAIFPQRTWAPWVSRQIGMLEYRRMRAIVGSTASGGVWERLMRKRSTPRSSRARMTSPRSEAGPRVQRILIFMVDRFGAGPARPSPEGDESVNDPPPGGTFTRPSPSPGRRLGWGPGRGDVVAIQFPNIAEACAADLAVASIGATCLAYPVLYRHNEVRSLLSRSGAVACLFVRRLRDFDYAAMMADLRPELPALKHLAVLGDPAAGCDSLGARLHAPGPP